MLPWLHWNCILPVCPSLCRGLVEIYCPNTHGSKQPTSANERGKRSPANESSFHQTFGLNWWRSSPFPHRVNTQRPEFPGTDLESSVLGKTTLWAADRSGLNKQQAQLQMLPSHGTHEVVLHVQHWKFCTKYVQLPVSGMRTKMDGVLFFLQKVCTSQRFFNIIISHLCCGAKYTSVRTGEGRM